MLVAQHTTATAGAANNSRQKIVLVQVTGELKARMAMVTSYPGSATVRFNRASSPSGPSTALLDSSCESQIHVSVHLS